MNSAGNAQSVDPNEILGPTGYGDEGWISGTDTLSYRINFENDSKATAPAQRVDVWQNLDENLDWSTFRFTGFGFADVAISLDKESYQINQTVTMDVVPLGATESVSILVDVSAGIDMETGRIYASFQTVDSDSEYGLPPFDINTGFLLPTVLDANDEPIDNRGMGYLTYLVQPKEDIETGETFNAVATIQFDFGEVINTNQIDPHDPAQGTNPDLECWLTIDNNQPESQIVSVTMGLDENNEIGVKVKWTGNDIGSGIAFYDVYYSTDEGEHYTLWLTRTTDTAALFTEIVDGDTYDFKVVAYDNASNTNSGVVANITVDSDKPIVTLPDNGYIVQEGCSLHLSAEGSRGDGLTYLWNLNPEENPDEYSDQYGESFWISTRQLGFEAGTYTIGLKVRDSHGIESLPVSATITILEVLPCITVKQTSFLDGQVLKLDIGAFYYGKRSVSQWIVNWGDDVTSPTTVNCCSSSLTTAHYYQPLNDTASYNIILSVIDTNGNGANVSYYLGTHTVNGTQVGESQSVDRQAIAEAQTIPAIVASLPITEESPNEQLSLTVSESKAVASIDSTLAILLSDRNTTSRLFSDDIPVRSTINSRKTFEVRDYRPLPVDELNNSKIRAALLESVWDDEFDLLEEADITGDNQYPSRKTSLECEIFAQDELDEIFMPYL